jgi:hypothetical protein
MNDLPELYMSCRSRDSRLGPPIVPPTSCPTNIDWLQVLWCDLAEIDASETLAPMIRSDEHGGR